MKLPEKAQDREPVFDIRKYIRNVRTYKEFKDLEPVGTLSSGIKIYDASSFNSGEWSRPPYDPAMVVGNLKATNHLGETREFKNQKMLTVHGAYDGKIWHQLTNPEVDIVDLIGKLKFETNIDALLICNPGERSLKNVENIVPYTYVEGNARGLFTRNGVLSAELSPVGEGKLYFKGEKQ